MASCNNFNSLEYEEKFTQHLHDAEWTTVKTKTAVRFQRNGTAVLV